MKKTATRRPEPAASTSTATASASVTPRSLQILAGLGALSTLWALVLWRQLAVARAGGQPFCPLGDAGDCARAWDSAFASAVHAATGLPVAAWGVVWGLVAFLLPLLAAKRAEVGDGPALRTAVRLTAAAGVLAVSVTAGVSASEGAFCGGCFIWYLLVASYAAVALLGWRRLGLPDLPGGLAWSAGAVLLAFVALLYPGVKTPRSTAQADKAVLAGAPSLPPVAPPVREGEPNPQLAAFLATLAPDQKKQLADSLGIYRRSPALTLPPPRTLLGPEAAPVRFTEFTDVLCGHCATLHESFRSLRPRLPAGSFNVEPRHFPLDAECNPGVQRKGDPTRCLGAKARICVEGKPGAEAFAGALFANQRVLNPEMVYSLAAPVLARPALEACVASAETGARLRDDIDLATRYHVDGTPLVLVNGRRGTSLPTFLYAMVLSGGADDDPAFAVLPMGNPDAHVH